MQAEYWNGTAGERWATSQAEIDRSLERITQDLWLPWVAPKPTDRVLDIGCGTGTTTMMMRERAGAASGVDVSAPMLALAKQRAPELSFSLADAATAKFAAEYDLVVSRFGVMFFEEPVAAFKNLRTALAPGGRLAFVCWRAFADNEWAALPMAVASEFMTHPPADPIAPGPFAFADKKRVEGILAEAGFRDIAIEPRDSIMDQGATIDDAVTSTLTFGPLSRAAAEIDEATRTKLRARLKATIPTKPSAAVWLVSAR